MLRWRKADLSLLEESPGAKMAGPSSGSEYGGYCSGVHRVQWQPSEFAKGHIGWLCKLGVSRLLKPDTPTIRLSTSFLPPFWAGNLTH
jgi:hypothetical protein